MSNKSGVAGNVVDLPSGGGALQGLGETFSPDPFTGTANFTVPLALPPGRNGLQPDLNLVYSSGNGNGPFGLGWQLSLPVIARKTSKGVPKYQDTSPDGDDHDIFVLTGAEDLVAARPAAGAVSEFRPRTEGMFARIERILDEENDAWRVRGQDGNVSVYGTEGHRGDDPAVVADPQDRTKVGSWWLSETTDPFGNRVRYHYLRDTDPIDGHDSDQVYLERVEYINYPDDDRGRFLVSVEFSYDERPDPFSDRRFGFEVRTRLRCQRIEIRTRPDREVLSRSYQLIYHDELVAAGEQPESSSPPNGVSLLRRVTTVGHDGEATEKLPALDLRYSSFDVEGRKPEKVSGVDDSLPERSLADVDLEVVDLFGNGLPDIVEMGEDTVFWRNLGDGLFEAPRAMSEIPSDVRLADRDVRLGDLNGNGRADLLVTRLGGYFPLSFRGRWSREGFVAYDHQPSFSLDSPDLRLLDITGDGVVDALHTGSEFTFFHNNPVTGWDRVETIPRRGDDEFPDVRFSDPRIKLADMTGDGLQDIIRVDKRSVEYWPYLGHGRWGRRIEMGSSPDIDDPSAPPGLGFDPDRLLFGDVDGDGVDDVIYVEADRVTVWINRGGDGFASPIVITDTPTPSSPDAIRLIDLRGTGSRGFLWTNERVDGAGAHYQYLDLTGGSKPYLLNQIDNNMGAVTRVTYASSTEAYLADEVSGDTTWQTPLPFPVQVVRRVEQTEEFSGGALTTTYHYHHGYWDGAEREFRGFGRVDQLDSESLPRLRERDSMQEELLSPPTLTKTWFHLGPIGEESGSREEADFTSEYWAGDPSKLERSSDTTRLLESLDNSDRADALRTLRGSVLRSELYAHDETDRRDRPFTVTENVYGIREEVASSDTHRSVFFPHKLSERVTRWDRSDDPMTRFIFTTDHDRFGHPQTQTEIACPRGWRDPSVPPGQPYLATRTRTDYATPADPEIHLTDRIAKVDVFEIVNDGSQTLTEVANTPRNDPSIRLIGETLHHYDGDPFVGLPLGQVGSHGALTRTESLIATEQLLRDFFRGDSEEDSEAPTYLDPDERSPTPSEYPTEFLEGIRPLAGYQFHDGNNGTARGYFQMTEGRAYDFQRPNVEGRGLIEMVKDPHGTDTVFSYDRYRLFPIAVTDPVGLVTRYEHDYRVLQPVRMTDPNGNRTVVTYTPTGLLSSSAVMGKVEEKVGDSEVVPGTRFEYSLEGLADRPEDERQPISVRTIQRVHHHHDTDVAPVERENVVETVEYTDGRGRLLQTRVQAEDVVFGDALFGDGVITADQSEPVGAVGGRRQDGEDRNVMVTGAKVYDNKGRVVEKYEPFFARGFGYESPHDHPKRSKLSTRYDPRGEVVASINPDGSMQVVTHGVPGTIATPDLSDPTVFEPTPWEAYTYDANDNARRTHGVGDPTHFDTPRSVTVDGLGRPVDVVDRNGADSDSEWITTRYEHDIRGNLLRVTDHLGRNAYAAKYDLANQAWRTESIDGGVRKRVLDAAGNEIERRDSKGTLVLRQFDLLHRPSRMWARDDGDGPVTLRERLEYGDGGTPDQAADNRSSNRDANRLGVLHRHFDEAGLLVMEGYDHTGELAATIRQVFGDDVLLGSGESAFRVDWEPPPGVDLETHAKDLLDPFQYRSASALDALGNTKTVLYPEDAEGHRRELRSSYNSAGALDGVRIDNDVIIERIAYDAKGQRTLEVLGNGVMTRYAYHPQTFHLQRMRSERFDKSDGDGLVFQPRGRPLQDLAYQHDLVGNIITIHDRTPASGVPNTANGGDALDRQFTYDPLYRLTKATGRECSRSSPRPPWDDRPQCSDPNLVHEYDEDYSYDSLGNMTRMRHVTENTGSARRFEHRLGTNRLHTVTDGGEDPLVLSYRHDANGNLTEENNVRHFQWDHSDRMIGFRIQTGDATPSVIAWYLYDSSGNRVKKLVKKSNGIVETTVYIDGVYEHHRWRRGSTEGSNTRIHVTDDRKLIASLRIGDVHPDDGGPAVQYHIGDHLGNSTVTIDDGGGLISREEYRPYGETSFGSFTRKRHRFNGKERDEESGLNYHGARYYSPGLGRWSSCDPAYTGFALRHRPASPPLSSRLHTYAGLALNPLRYIDPDGAEPEPPKRGLWRWLVGKGKRSITILRFIAGIDWANPGHSKVIADKPREHIEKAEKETTDASRAKKAGASGGDPPDPERTRLQKKVNQLAKRRNMTVKKQGGFARIGAMGFIAIATSAGVFLASEDKLDVAVAIGADMALGALLFKVTKSGGIAGILTMVLTMPSDSAKHNEAVEKREMINEIIKENFPGEYKETREWGIFVDVETGPNYGKIYKKVEYLIDHPYELKDRPPSACGIRFCCGTRK